MKGWKRRGGWKERWEETWGWGEARRVEWEEGRERAGFWTVALNLERVSVRFFWSVTQGTAGCRFKWLKSDDCLSEPHVWSNWKERERESVCMKGVNRLKRLSPYCITVFASVCFKQLSSNWWTFSHRKEHVTFTAFWRHPYEALWCC